MSRAAPASRTTERPTCAATRPRRKTLLPEAAGHGATAIFQSIDEIGARALPGRIQPHGETGQEREPEREEQHRRIQRDAILERKIVAREFRNDRDNPERKTGADDAGDQTDEHAFENEQPDDATRATRPAPSATRSRAGGR